MTDQKAPPERRVVLPVDPTRRTEIDKQRVPMSARPYRLLALVKQDAVVRVQKEPDDTVMTWPHLLAIEFLAAAAMSVFMLMMGLIVNAPLEELANPNVTPEIAKAPWYFLGLQELLAYFHPTVAGALVPIFVLVGAALIPFVDRGNLTAVRPSDRKTTVVLFTLFCGLGLVRDVPRDLLPGSRLRVHPALGGRLLLHPVTGAASGRDGRHEQLPRRARQQARRPSRRRPSSPCATRRPRGSRGASSCGRRWAPGSASGSWRSRRARLSFLWPNLSGGFGGKVTIGTLQRASRTRTPPCRSPRASRPTTRRPAPS